MKKSKKRIPHEISEVTPEEALQFIASVHQMLEDKDSPTRMISLRVPENLLNAYKIKAKSQGKKYQSLMIEAFRRELRRS